MGYFAGKRILITGIASGLGKGMALRMARKGGQIIGWDYNAEALDEVLFQLKLAGGRPARGFVCDVSDHAAVAAMADEVKGEVGAIDILINNAGVVSGKRFLDCSTTEIERTIGVNTMALFWTVRAFLPDMIARNAGHLVTVSSAAGLVGVAKLADYCASKFAAVGFDESLRAELRQTAPNVHTTVICPYYINTGMFDGVRSRFSWLLPISDEYDAVRRMVNAIEKRRPRPIMPPLVYTIPLIRLLPVSWFDWIASFLGVNVSMDQFKGRAAQKE